MAKVDNLWIVLLAVSSIGLAACAVLVFGDHRGPIVQVERMSCLQPS